MEVDTGIQMDYLVLVDRIPFVPFEEAKEFCISLARLAKSLDKLLATNNG